MKKSPKRHGSSGYLRRHVCFCAATLLLLFSTFLIAPRVMMQQPRSYSFSVRNNSDHTINELYLSSNDRDYWGANQLGNGPLRPGQTFRLPDIRAGEYDLKLVDSNGGACVQRLRISDDVLLELSNDSLSKCEGKGNPEMLSAR